MSYKDVLALAVTLEDDEAALLAAQEIASKLNSRAIVLSASVRVGSAFAQRQALSAVLSDIAKGSQSEAALEHEKILAWLRKAGRDFEVRTATIESAVEADEVVAHARVADLVVMARAPSHQSAHRALLEDVLFKSGRPVLVTPGRPVQPRTWDRFVIAWNAKPEATRAVAAALPLLQAAKAVAVVTVDALPTRSGHGQAPGRELAAHLARHDVPVEVRNVDSTGRSEGRALLDESLGFDADAIVMGAYGHSRAQEVLFGGVTRELLNGAPTPLLLMH